jgi:hypothetical protein
LVNTVVEALILSNDDETRYQDITDSTKGIVFMGTPHLGADIAAWGRFLGRIGNVITIGFIRTDLIRDLKPKSREFIEIASSFVNRIARLQIVSFFERGTMGGVLVLLGRSSFTIVALTIA